MAFANVPEEVCPVWAPVPHGRGPRQSVSQSGREGAEGARTTRSRAGGGRTGGTDGGGGRNDGSGGLRQPEAVSDLPGGGAGRRLCHRPYRRGGEGREGPAVGATVACPVPSRARTPLPSRCPARGRSDLPFPTPFPPPPPRRSSAL